MSQSTIACVFPGQGSQSVGMLAELALHTPIIQATFAQASAVLGYDLWDVVTNDPDEILNQTHVTQPALLTASVAVYRALQDAAPFTPALMAGHSLGEYSALVCSGVLTLEDGVKLVKARGEFMQSAVKPGEGAMYAIIGLADEKIIEACVNAQNETSEIVSAVNFNSPGQVVIAGTTHAAEKAAAACKEAGAKRALPLSVSVPSHCELMAPAAEQLAKLMDTMTFNQPNIAFINNVDVNIQHDEAAIKDALVRQLSCPVRWTETVQLFATHNVDTVLEVGPGKVLTGLIKRIDKGLTPHSVNQPEHLIQY
ncbi:MAG: Malonyl CoA-acyl carrier protein transacylase [Glaciecola sp. HTCC2999]|jgi:[acyl-carrier-protein] S-malonyltransferase|nr:MAG: Malonyl CoA-acyl carrier protein transacylase [Glaciecola sp. HTCC2999]